MIDYLVMCKHSYLQKEVEEAYKANLRLLDEDSESEAKEPDQIDLTQDPEAQTDDKKRFSLGPK